MSSNFFEELDIPLPTVNLECGSGSQSEITSKIMVSFEKFLNNLNKKLKSFLIKMFSLTLSYVE